MLFPDEAEDARKYRQAMDDIAEPLTAPVETLQLLSEYQQREGAVARLLHTLLIGPCGEPMSTTEACDPCVCDCGSPYEDMGVVELTEAVSRELNHLRQVVRRDQP